MQRIFMYFPKEDALAVVNVYRYISYAGDFRYMIKANTVSFVLFTTPQLLTV